MNKMFLFLLCPLLSCTNHSPSETSFICFVGATIIDGTGDKPIQNGVLLIQKGKVVALGRKGMVSIPGNAEVIDISDRYVTPGLINAHGHVGDVKGIEAGYYSTENIEENLAIYARYGVTTVVSLGGDKEEAVPFRNVIDSLPKGRARLFIAGEIIAGDSPEIALPFVDKNHKLGVDLMKIRVDDHLGNAKKMTEDVYRAVINRSHELGYKIATHMYYLEDARKLVSAGTDLLAHSVRDTFVDQEFIELVKSKDIAYCPTLTRELSTFVYGDTAFFFSDPFFTKEYDQETIQPLKDPQRQLQIRNSRSTKIYEEHLPVAMTNLKRLSDEGIPIVFGTDSGVATRFMGYFEHLELEMMSEAGLDAMQIIISATKNAAKYLGLKELGTLSPGHWADFVILQEDPLLDIRNFRKIESVYIGGIEIPN